MNKLTDIPVCGMLIKCGAGVVIWAQWVDMNSLFQSSIENKIVFLGTQLKNSTSLACAVWFAEVIAHGMNWGLSDSSFTIVGTVVDKATISLATGK